MAASSSRQALADSMMKSVNASISKLRREDLHTIYIVPERIRQVNKVAYEPRIVSIGPYHKGKKRLQGMEDHKRRYLNSLLSRNPKHRLEDYLEEIEKSKDEARSCYSVKGGLHMGNEFVKMMMLDGCFIVELFLRCDELRQKEVKQKEEEVKPKEKELKQKDAELESKEEELTLPSALEFTELEPKEEELTLPSALEFTELEPKEEELILPSALESFVPKSEDSKDTIFNTIWMLPLIGCDMLLLENQIPFSILECIFNMACPNHVPHALAEMALYFFDQIMPRNKEIENKDRYFHLLHLFHSSHLITTPTHNNDPNLSRNSTVESVQNKETTNLLCNPTIESVLNKLKNIFPSSIKLQLPICNNPSPVSTKMIPCAAELQLAGVKFHKKTDSNSILDVKFINGVLEIPILSIQDHSDSLFRNLIAFEQCRLEAKNHVFTTYLVFMDYLVNTSKDVALLQQNGIIDNLLGSDDDVAHLFNRLCSGIVHSFDGSYLSHEKDKVQEHCQKKWHMWRASLKRDYFTNPWTVISSIAASILLLLTITQTFYTVFAYHRPRS